MDNKHYDSYQQLGLNIKFYRGHNRLTQEQLAEMIDVNSNHISLIERAEGGASLDVIFDIANALEIPVCKLFEFRA